MELNFAPTSMQIPTPKILHKTGSVIASVRLTTHVGRTLPMAYSQVHRLAIFVTPRKLRGYSLRLGRSSRYDGFYDRVLPEDVKRFESQPPFDDDTKGKNEKKVETNMQILPSKVVLLNPHELGINPEPPSWPEREEICSRLSIEQKASYFGIPHSLRILRNKQWKKGFVYAGEYAYFSVREAGEYAYSAYYSVKGAGESAYCSVKDAGEYAYCSVKKAFSSLVFIIRELHNQIWQIKENLQCEELRAILTSIQEDINSMFVWLFKQVFSKTPTLMLYVVLLLANYSVHSIDTQQKMLNQKARTTSVQDEESEEGWNGSDLGSLNIVMENSIMQGENVKVFYQQMIQKLLSGKLEPTSIATRDLLYRMNIDKEPKNPLLMVNYAWFLCKEVHDNDRAEEWFKRATKLETADADAFGEYANFLWNERHDEEAAEEKFNQAYEAEPAASNYYKAMYAQFLWSTGAEDTCYPLSCLNNKS